MAGATIAAAVPCVVFNRIATAAQAALNNVTFTERDGRKLVRTITGNSVFNGRTVGQTVELEYARRGPDGDYVT